MADYWTDLSFVPQFQDPAHHQFLCYILAELDNLEDESSILIPEDEFGQAAKTIAAEIFSSEETSAAVCFQLQLNEKGQQELWIYSDHAPYIDVIERAIRETLRYFDSNARVGFEWSHGCSKPLLDGFGGGAYCITKEGSQFFSSMQIIDAFLEGNIFKPFEKPHPSSCPNCSADLGQNGYYEVYEHIDDGICQGASCMACDHHWDEWYIPSGITVTEQDQLKS